MLTSNIKFKNFNILKSSKVKSFKNEKWFKKIKVFETLNPKYKYSYSKKQIKKFSKNKNFRLIRWLTLSFFGTFSCEKKIFNR